jgi:hypothetical protein
MVAPMLVCSQGLAASVIEMINVGDADVVKEIVERIDVYYETKVARYSEWCTTFVGYLADKKEIRTEIRKLIAESYAVSGMDFNQAFLRSAWTHLKNHNAALGTAGMRPWFKGLSEIAPTTRNEKVMVVLGIRQLIHDNDVSFLGPRDLRTTSEKSMLNDLGYCIFGAYTGHNGWLELYVEDFLKMWLLDPSERTIDKTKYMKEIVYDDVKDQHVYEQYGVDLPPLTQVQREGLQDTIKRLQQLIDQVKEETARLEVTNPRLIKAAECLLAVVNDLISGGVNKK